MVIRRSVRKPKTPILSSGKMEKPGKRGREQTGVGEGKKKKIYGGVRWRAVRGWVEGEGAVVIMGDYRQLRIDKMELWKIEVKAK